MKHFEQKWGNRKISMYTKVMFSIAFTLLAVIFIIQIANVHVINRTKQRADELYQGSLNYYGGFWEEKLRTINTSLLTIIGYHTGAAYGNICNSTDTQKKINMSVKEFADNEKISNNKWWTVFFVDNKPYLFKLFKMGNGYAGALLETELILEGFGGNKAKQEWPQLKMKKAKLSQN